MSSPRVIVAAKRTAYGRYVDEEDDPEVRRLLRARDPSVARWLLAHREHEATLREVLRALAELGATPWLVQGAGVAFDATDAELVVTVGGDGTLLAASHHVDRAPVLGVNSSPTTSVGFFCAADRGNVARLLGRALDGRLAAARLARMQVQVNRRVVSRRVLNEALFCHATPAAASRYLLREGGREEAQVSSGFWVGTPAGSTGAIHSAGGRVLPLTAEKLQLVVREPLVSRGAPLCMTHLVVGRESPVVAVSKMRDACLFLDGPFIRAPVRLGDRVTFSLSREPLSLLGVASRRGRGAR